MRIKERQQTSLFDHYVEHETGHELKSISMLLDKHKEILEWVEKDIQTINLKDASGRKSMSVESVLRCAILKQHRQLSYEELSFTLLDSLSCQTFARLTDKYPSKINLTVLRRIFFHFRHRINRRIAGYVTIYSVSKMVKKDK